MEGIHQRNMSGGQTVHDTKLDMSVKFTIQRCIDEPRSLFNSSIAEELVVAVLSEKRSSKDSSSRSNRSIRV